MPDTPNLLPRPDPTALTTEAIRQNIAHVEALLMQLIDERTLRFQGELQARDKAIDAALASTKEAIAKTEKAHREQVTALGSELKAELGSLRNRISDIRESLSAGEVRAGILSGKGAGSQQAITLFLSIGALIVMTVGIIVGAIVSTSVT